MEKNKQLPAVSVIMSVYNTEEAYLREAIESILQQTFTDFEFIIVNDASTQECRAIIDSYSDCRIKRIDNPENMGLTKSLNIALDRARGKYIVRMDADDISLKERIEKQYSFMESRTDVAVAGCIARIAGKEEYLGYFTEKKASELRTALLFGNLEIVHPSVIIRKSFLEEYHLQYDPQIKKAQDYALWVECTKYGKLVVMPECLFEYRKHAQQISSRNAGEQNHYAQVIRLRQINALAEKFTEEEREAFLHMQDYGAVTNLVCIKNVLNQINGYNHQTHLWNEGLLKRALTLIWLFHIRSAVKQHRWSQIPPAFWSIRQFFPVQICYCIRNTRLEKKKIRQVYRAISNGIKS